MEIYFLSSQDPDPGKFDVRFRVEDMNVELWHSDDGSIEPAGYAIQDGFTSVPLELDGYGSVFVVFRGTATSAVRIPGTSEQMTLMRLEGPWEVNFQPGLGAPEKIMLQELEPWTENPDEGVRYYSGPAIYRKSFKAPGAWLKSGADICLDLGDVKDLAEVSLNGQEVAILWKEPYRVNLTGLLKKGTNLLEITVINQWTNRITGDREAEEGDRVLDPASFSRFGRPQVDESGLLGPVELISISHDAH
jgi:hypothetical protein